MLDFTQKNDIGAVFLPLDKRSDKQARFIRIAGYNDDVKDFILKYYAAAGKKGIAVTGKLPSPDERQVSYFVEMLGRQFQLDKFFIGKSLGRWVPQLRNEQCKLLADAIYQALLRFQSLGKNEAMIRNLYVRLMCWLYYKFADIARHAGENDAPKILYGGPIGRHDLYMLKVLHDCSCDVVFLQYGGEAEYNSLDPKSELSQKLTLPNMGAYPAGFSLEAIKAEEAERKKLAQLLGEEPRYKAATNIWLKGKNILEDLREVPVTRGKDDRFFYNAFCRVNGAEDKLTYQNELYTFYMEMKNSGRRYLIIEDRIPMPQNDELNAVDRGSFQTKEQLLGAMLKCIKMPADEQLKRIITRSFADVLFDEASKPDMKMQRLTTMATCAVCWFNRYLPSLMGGWSMPLVSLFIYLGGCKSGHEAAFLRMLSRLPCDVLILVPNLNTRCQLEDKTLFELNYSNSVNMTEYPTEASALQFGTVAYHAERELDDALYNGETGIYRDYQYKKANSVILKTMYEEIDILWKQETKYRPNFSVTDGIVNVPVLFAKISGVKDSQPAKYWKTVQSMITENTLVINGAPFFTQDNQNPMRYSSASFIRGGKLRRDVIRSERYYRYGHLREETQTYIFDKIDLLMNSHIISGTYENGTEYLIAETLLDLPPAIVRLIQSFDFTKHNPKVIYINVGENPISIQDSIIMAFLSLAGFDVLFFVPTGYYTVENFFNKEILDEHKVGEFMYDLQVPKFKPPKPAKPQAAKSKPLFGHLFKKGK